jgi:MSHA biogenesis protein MshQ
VSSSVSRVTSPSTGNKPETCAAGQFNGGAIDIYGLPVSTGAGDKTSISFWMNWDGSNSVMPMGFHIHDLWTVSGSFGFNTGGGDIYGISSAGLANTWHHVTVIFTNNNVRDNKIYINGVEQALTHRRGSIIDSRSVVNEHLRLGGWWYNNGYRYRGQLDEVKIYKGEISQATIDKNRTQPSPCYTPIAEYRFDELSWNGSAEEVIDSSNSNFHGLAVNGTNTANIAPAIAGEPGTCRYGQFDGVDDYLAVSDIPNLTNNFTISAWIKSTKNSRGRIFADDDSKTSGYALSLNEPGSGKVRFFSRGVQPVSLDTSAVVVPQDDNWYFVTAVHDADSKNRFIYVNGDLKASGTYTGTWGKDDGIATIGSESNASREGVKFAPFQGNIDEFRVYSTALNQIQIQTIMDEKHTCPAEPPLDHFELSYAKNGLACLPSQITVKACADASCTTLITDDVEVTFSPATGWANNPVIISNGQATLNLNHPTPGNLDITITASSNTPTNNTLSCLADNVSDPTCSITVAETGFIFDVPTLTACKTSADVTIKAVKTGENTTQCISALTGNKTLSFWSEYDIPATGNNKVKINGADIATSNTGTNIDLTFDSNGEAQFTAQYDDAGQLNLTATYDESNGLSMMGTDSFVSTPVAVVSYSDDNNADCVSQSASCSVFKKAGEEFNQTIKAACWTHDGDTDYTDNPETSNFVLASIGISNNVLAPTGGANGQLKETSFNFASSDNGIHTLQQTISEVGVFEFSLTLPTYFTETLNGVASPAIGRFRPDHFKTTTGDDGSFGSGACTGSGFSYSGQTFSYQTNPQLIVTAYNVANPAVITQNYRDGFAKLIDTDLIVTTPVTDTNQLGADNTNLVRLTWQAASPTLNDNNDGTHTFTFGNDNYTYTHETNSQIAPFTNAIDLTFTRVRDSDNVNASTLPYTLQPSGENIRFGRIALDSAHGSELAPLTIGLRTEFFNGSGWLPNTQDQCTSISLTNHIRLKVDGGNFQTGNSTVTIQSGTSSATLANNIISDNGSLSLSAPGEDNQGYVDIRSNISATHSWLLDLNNGEAQSRASFGLFRGDDNIIFRRERY